MPTQEIKHKAEESEGQTEDRPVSLMAEYFRRNFRFALKRRRLSYRDITERTGVAKSTISRIFNLTNGTSLATGQLLANSVGFDLPDLLVRPDLFEARFR